MTLCCPDFSYYHGVVRSLKLLNNITAVNSLLEETPLVEEIPGMWMMVVRHHKLNFMLPDTGDTGEASFTGAKVENVTFAYEVNGFAVDRENDLNHKVSETKTDTILDHYTLTLQPGQITGIHGQVFR